MAYYDSKYHTKMWELLSGDIYRQKNNPVYQTLKPIYKGQKHVAYVTYNDQPPHKFK
ncbi:hypothetical protein MRX96_053777, partial [Rhipicephalus microplus]